jgi:hypothetical protein
LKTGAASIYLPRRDSPPALKWWADINLLSEDLNEISPKI